MGLHFENFLQEGTFRVGTEDLNTAGAVLLAHARNDHASAVTADDLRILDTFFVAFLGKLVVGDVGADYFT